MVVRYAVLIFGVTVALWTGPWRIGLSDGNANRVAVIHLFSRLWRLINNESGLKRKIGARCQDADVQVSSAKFCLGAFIA